jgi:ubiquinone/menaquinone biosynthesis C-methylase UbiE
MPERVLFHSIGIADPAHYLHARYFMRAFRAAKRGRCLDAGCGRGDYSLYMARRANSVLGLDVNGSLIERNIETAARLGLGNTTFVTQDLVTFDAKAEFDFAVCIDVLEHIPDNRKALENILRALKPGGSAFLHFPVKRPRPVPLHRFLHGFHAWAEEEHVADELTAEEFVRMVEDVGFAVSTRQHTFGYWTGELATSVFALPYSDTPVNRIAQAALSPLCRGLAALDPLGLDGPHYAVAVQATAR